MFILRQGIIKQSKTSIQNISNSKVIFIYPDKNSKITKNIIKKKKELKHNKNSNFKENNILHKKNHPNLYSKSLESPLYSIKFPNISADCQKQNAIKEAFIHSWNGYKKFCWSHDIFHPVSKTCTDYLKGGLTIIDSLSTLIIMGLDEELEFSKKYISKKISP